MTTSRRALTAGLALLGAGVLASPALAQTSGIKTSFSGFGTLVGTVTDKDDIYVISSPLQTKGADKDVDFGMDSRIGLQGRVEFDPTLSVTGQLIAQRRVDKDFDPEVEWLFGQWSGVPGLNLRFGRVVLPSFLVSDSRFVSYALPGIRVPALVYGMMPLSSIDGVQALYSHRVGAANLSFTASAGKGVEIASTSDYRHVLNLAAQAEVGDWTFRYGYVQADSTVSLGQLGDLEYKDKFHNVAAQYDNGSWFATAEYVRRKTDTGVLDMSGWYLTAGTRLGKWTPYATISRSDIDSGNAPAAYVPVAPGVTFPYVLLTPDNNGKGAAVGVRYDVAANVALKAEYGQYKGGSPFVFKTVDDSGTPAPDQKVNTLSLGLDFVF